MPVPVPRARHPLGDVRAPEDFSLRIDVTTGRIVLVGELDRRSAHHLLDAVRTLGGTGPRGWVLDVGGVQFCDTGGLRAINACYRQAVHQGSTLTVVDAGPWLRRALAALKLGPHVFSGDHPTTPGAPGDPITGSAVGSRGT
jgi:anti-anti-sigma factor